LLTRYATTALFRLSLLRLIRLPKFWKQFATAPLIAFCAINFPLCFLNDLFLALSSVREQSVAGVRARDAQQPEMGDASLSEE